LNERDGRARCEELLDKKYGEILSEENLRVQLRRCLNRRVFDVSNLKFILDESSLSIIFPPQLFKDISLFHAGKPSKKKIGDFFERCKTLANESKGEISVGARAKPSHTNMQMDVTFTFRRLRKEKGVKLCRITIRDILAYLEDKWKSPWKEFKYDLKTQYGHKIYKATLKYKRRSQVFVF